MIYRILGDMVLIAHFAFVAFALFGGLLAIRCGKLLCVHLPALAWGIFVEWADRTCPLTPLENRLRRIGGEAGYPADFIEHFVGKILYPGNLTIELRYVLGAILAAVNVAIYGYLLRQRRRRTRLE